MEEPCSPTVSLYLGLCTRLVVGVDILDGCSKEMGEAGSELIASGPSSKVLIFVFVGSLRDPTPPDLLSGISQRNLAHLIRPQVHSGLLEGMSG